MKANTIMIGNTDLESILGRMDDNTLVTGKMENNMEKVLINSPMAKKRKEFGRMEKG